MNVVSGRATSSLMMMINMDENRSTTGTCSASSRGDGMVSSAVTTKPATLPVVLEGMIEHRLLDTFLKATNACDKFFNCAYVTKQLEDEWHQEHVLAVPDVTGGGVVAPTATTTTTTTTTTAMNRVWNKMERSFQVEAYRQFLFDESSFEDNSEGEEEDSGHDDNKELSSLLPSYGSQHDVASIPNLQRTRS